MKLIRGGLATIGLLAVAGAAQAGVTSTWTVTNDYDFRGNSQSAKDPAIQASLDYAAASGWYVGAWASNIDFGVPSGGPLENPDVELDVLRRLHQDAGVRLGVRLRCRGVHLSARDRLHLRRGLREHREGLVQGEDLVLTGVRRQGGEGSVARQSATAAACRPGTSKATRPSRCRKTSRCSVTSVTAPAITGTTRSATISSTGRSAWATRRASSTSRSSTSIRTAT